MTQNIFDGCVQNLRGRREEVLKLFLQGESDRQISEDLSIAAVTIRTHIFDAHTEFKKAGLIENGNDPGYSHRDELTDLFVKYRRKWVSNVVLNRLGYPSNHFFKISDSNSYITRGIEYFYRLEYQQAIDLFKRAVDSDPTDPIAEIFLNNAKAYLRGIPLKIGVVVSYAQNDFHIDASRNVLRGVADAQTKFNSNDPPGRLLEIIIADDRNQPERAIEIAKLLAEDPNILGIIGHHSSEGTQAALPIYEEYLLPTISSTSTSSRLRSKIFFRTIGSTEIVADRYARYITDSLNLQEIVVLHHEGNEYSQTLRDDFEVAFKKQKGTIIESIPNINDPRLDIASLMKKIDKQKKAKAILTISSIETNSVALAIARENSKLNSSGLHLLFSTSLPEQLTLEKGGNALEGVLLVHPKLEKESDYMQKARNRWQQQEINWRVATSYDATQALIKAIRLSKDPTRSAILDNLETIKLPIDLSSGFGLSWSGSDDRSNIFSEYCISKICDRKFEEIMVYKFGNLTRDEVNAMLGIELEQTRVYKDAKAEGKAEEGRSLVLKLLTRKLGTPIGLDLQSQVNSLTIEQIESLGEALLDFQGIDELVNWLNNN
jgi:branched-chain amino acid transport system substrate-binding protein